MDCLRSFSFISGANENAVSPEIKTWLVGTNNYWLYSSTNPQSVFNPVGFKNINVYSIQCIGNVYSLTSGTSGVLVEDWHWAIQTIGQNATIGSTITSGGFSIQEQNINPTFFLGKFNNSINFESPLQSITSLRLNGFYAQGIGAENIANINLAWSCVFNVYYKFEGE
jgi:hypothetical protein